MDKKTNKTPWAKNVKQKIKKSIKKTKEQIKEEDKIMENLEKELDKTMKTLSWKKKIILSFFILVIIVLVWMILKQPSDLNDSTEKINLSVSPYSQVVEKQTTPMETQSIENHFSLDTLQIASEVISEDGVTLKNFNFQIPNQTDSTFKILFLKPTDEKIIFESSFLKEKDSLNEVHLNEQLSPGTQTLIVKLIQYDETMTRELENQIFRISVVVKS